MQEETSSSDISICPSFNVYASGKLAEISSQISNQESEPGFEDDGDCGDYNYVYDDDEDFEFSLVRPDPGETSVLAGEVFCNGQIRPVFPIFNRDLLLSNYELSDRELSSIQGPMKNILIDERQPPSSSSSEADEWERIKPGAYCVWSPKTAEPSPGRCKKSKSTGSSSSSKRWRFIRDLLRRSNSDGKDAYVYLTHPGKKIEQKSEEGESSKARRSSGEVKVAGKVKAKGKGVAAGEKVSAHEAFYVRNRAIKEGDKRRSYLPYKQNLVGFISNVNGLGRSFPPF